MKNLLIADCRWPSADYGEASKASARCLAAFLPRVENRWGGWGDQIRLVSGMRCKAGILERAVAEWVIKCITVIHLITHCIGSSYRNAPFGIEILVARS